MRVVILTQWFEPEPTFKGLKFAKSLLELGHTVEVVTGFPNYPGGKLYEGYHIKLCLQEEMEKVKVTRLPLFPSHDSSSIRRSLNYLSFFVSTFIYMTFFMKKADVIYAYHPPITVGLAAVLIKKLRKTPVTLDVQDLWPDTLVATGMVKSRLLLSLVGLICSFTFSIADMVVVQSNGFKEAMIKRGIPANKVKVVLNWHDEEAHASGHVHTYEKKSSNDKQFVVMYAGNLGKAQSLTTVLDAAKILKSTSEKIKFVFVGSGLEQQNLIDRARLLNLDNIEFLQRVPINEIGKMIEKADALLIHLRKDKLFEITIPSKTQAYMLSSKPILMGVEGDAAHIVSKAKCGVLFEPENARALADAAKSLSCLEQNTLNAMGLAGLNYYKKNMGMKAGVLKFSKIFQSIASQKNQ